MRLQTKTAEIDLNAIDNFIPTKSIIDLPVHIYLESRKAHANGIDRKIITDQHEYRVFPLKRDEVNFHGAIGIRSSHSRVELTLWPYVPKGAKDSDHANVFDPEPFMSIVAAIENHTFDYGKGWKFEETCKFEFGNFSGPTSIYSKKLFCAHFAQKLIRQIEGAAYLYGFDKPQDTQVYRSYYEVDINPDGDYSAKHD